MKKIVVVGAGIIGTSIAHELALRGFEVCLIEQDAEVGMGCSYGNAGWMTPCFAMPLPMPGMLLKSVKWLLNPESPLYIKPKPSLLLIEWMTRFLLAMNEKQAKKAIHNLVRLSQVSLDAYNAFSESENDFAFTKKGLLMCAQSSEGVQAAIDELRLTEYLGVTGQILNASEIRDFEPSLKGSLAGGVYFHKEAHSQPHQVVKSLAKRARALGVEIKTSCGFFDFKEHHEAGKIQSVLTSQGEIPADAVVMATGSWSHGLAKKLRLNVPILGGKGYSMILDPLPLQPQYPMMLIEKKIAITPYENSLRVAGTLELVDQDFSITQRRVQAIIKGTREFMPDFPKEPKVNELWRGLRPCTPDGLPLIGWNPSFKNLMMAVGHQMLGLQTGYGTGIMVADLMEDKQTGFDLEIFSPMRF